MLCVTLSTHAHPAARMRLAVHMDVFVPASAYAQVRTWSHTIWLCVCLCVCVCVLMGACDRFRRIWTSTSRGTAGCLLPMSCVSWLLPRGQAQTV